MSSAFNASLTKIAASAPATTSVFQEVECNRKALSCLSPFEGDFLEILLNSFHLHFNFPNLITGSYLAIKKVVDDSLLIGCIVNLNSIKVPLGGEGENEWLDRTSIFPSLRIEESQK